MLTAALAAAAVAASFDPLNPPARVEVTSMPAFNAALPSKMWSGYVKGGVPPSGKGTMYFHYLAFEAEEDPANAPTLFWYNGGPGASSLFGIFQELGPFALNALSAAQNQSGVPQPIYNPKAWNKRANLIALDSPPPVGFSYCTEQGPSGGGTSCGPWKDTDVFKANHEAVTALMNDVFPEWLKNPLYISGESYAGVYVPGLINELLDDPRGLNVQGFAVGDGCMGFGVACMDLSGIPFQYPGVWAGPWYDVLFFGGHGQMSNQLFDAIMKTCPEADLRSGNLNDVCKDLVNQMKEEVGGFYVYDLYDDCPDNVFGLKHGMNKAMKHRTMLHQHLLGGAENAYICPGNAFVDYVSTQAVREAFGVALDTNFFNADNGKGFDYNLDSKDVRPIYARAAKAGLRILSYEGDSDACGLSSYGLQEVYDQLWTHTEGLQKTQPWRPWTVDGKTRMGGYAMEWGDKIAHLTFRGSGHLVPLNYPDQAYTMIDSFIFGRDYPHYNPDAKY